MRKMTVTAKTPFEGIHCYPEAPEEVAFLRTPHRHIFGVTVEVEVFSDDRDIEFIMMKHKLNQFITLQSDNGVWFLGRTSCEQVACMVAKFLYNSYLTRGDERGLKVTVDEDGENGASLEVDNAYNL